MKLTLNVGCGGRTFKEYPEGYTCINFDQRDIPGHTDAVGDVRSLPYPNEHFDYILASDIIEHFPIAQTQLVLKEWRRVLKGGGVIEFRLPNIRAICKRYVSGEYQAELTSWLLFGGQDYPGNFHFVGFDREFFRDTVVPVGFKEIEYKDSDNNFEAKYMRI